MGTPDAIELGKKGIWMKKVLYVEDSRDTAEAVRLILGNAGIETDIANDGKEGLGKAKEKQYHLVLLDVMLPDMSGWDIYDSLRKSNYSAKFAFISGIPISNERFGELKNKGVCDYIMKPFKAEEFVSRMKKIVDSD
ncbi:MAG: response regulator [Candidatus Micrarchaeota archaeon]